MVIACKGAGAQRARRGIESCSCTVLFALAVRVQTETARRAGDLTDQESSFC